MYQNNDKSCGNVKSSKGEKYMKMIKPIWHSLPENVIKKDKNKLTKVIDLQVEN